VREVERTGGNRESTDGLRTIKDACGNMLFFRGRRGGQSTQKKTLSEPIGIKRFVGTPIDSYK